MVIEELLRAILIATGIYEQLIAILGDIVSQSRTSKQWIANLIKPGLLMMVFLRAERDASWPVHVWAEADMLPGFFASSHCNYAR